MQTYTTVNHELMDWISPEEYDHVMRKLRSFFEKEGLTEAYAQNRLSILAACEDPTSVATHVWDSAQHPLPQTNQMWLEKFMLENPTSNGYYTSSTSFRDELSPIPGRHAARFSLQEIEIPGDFNTLLSLECRLLEWLGYGDASSFPIVEYRDACEKYGVDVIEHEQEKQLYEDYGSAVLLVRFPETEAFWNMRKDPDNEGYSLKCDVILSGQETIGSAERETDCSVMLSSFNTVSDGKYRNKLYHSFGAARTNKELDEYFNHEFFPRAGGGIGLNRLIRSLKMEGLWDSLHDSTVVESTEVETPDCSTTTSCDSCTTTVEVVAEGSLLTDSFEEITEE